MPIQVGGIDFETKALACLIALRHRLDDACEHHIAPFQRWVQRVSGHLCGAQANAAKRQQRAQYQQKQPSGCMTAQRCDQDQRGRQQCTYKPENIFKLRPKRCLAHLDNDTHDPPRQHRQQHAMGGLSMKIRALKGRTSWHFL